MAKKRGAKKKAGKKKGAKKKAAKKKMGARKRSKKFITKVKTKAGVMFEEVFPSGLKEK